MVKVHLVAVILAGLAVYGCDDGAQPRTSPPARWPTVKTCRGSCYVWRTLKCLDVEVACGRGHGVFVVEGLPYNCAEVEPVACRLSRGMEACLDQCGEEPGGRSP